MTAVQDSAPAGRRFGEALAVYLRPRVLIVMFLGLLLRPAARAVGLDAAGVDARSRRRSRHHRAVRAGRHALHHQVPVGAAGRRARRAGAFALARTAARLARLRAIAADGRDRCSSRSRDPGKRALAGRIRRAHGRGRLRHAGHRDRCVPGRDAAAERAGRRHGVVRRRLSDRHADLDRRRAVPGERLRGPRSRARTAPGPPAIWRWRPAC